MSTDGHTHRSNDGAKILGQNNAGEIGHCNLLRMSGACSYFVFVRRRQAEMMSVIFKVDCALSCDVDQRVGGGTVAGSSALAARLVRVFVRRVASDSFFVFF